MAVKFKSTININDQYTFPSTVGTDGQYLSITDAAAGQLDWTNIGDVDGLKSNFVYYDAKNSTGSTIPVGTAVMAVGTDGNSGHILIAPMVADGSVEPKYFIGVTDTAIDNGVIGKVVHFGTIDQVDTTLFSDGQVLWCDPSVPGGFTTTEPNAPGLKLASAIVLNSSVNGKLLVRVQGNEGMHELHDVNIQSATDGQILVWDNAQGYWKNVDLPENTSVGISGSEVSGVVTIQGGGDTSVFQSGNTITIASSGTVRNVSSHNITDATTTQLTLSETPLSDLYVDLYVSGVYQPKSAYTVSGNILTFSEPFPLGSVVEAMISVEIQAAAPTTTTTTATPTTTTTTATPTSFIQLTRIISIGSLSITSYTAQELQSIQCSTCDPNGYGGQLFKVGRVPMQLGDQIYSNSTEQPITFTGVIASNALSESTFLTPCSTNDLKTRLPYIYELQNGIVTNVIDQTAPC